MDGERLDGVVVMDDGVLCHLGGIAALHSLRARTERKVTLSAQ